jgi:hypothetical protein
MAGDRGQVLSYKALNDFEVGEFENLWRKLDERRNLSTYRRTHCISCGAYGTLRCSGCNTVRYCSDECRSIHWVCAHMSFCPGAVKRRKDSKVTSKTTKEEISSTDGKELEVVKAIFEEEKKVVSTLENVSEEYEDKNTDLRADERKPEVEEDHNQVMEVTIQVEEGQPTTSSSFVSDEFENSNILMYEAEVAKEVEVVDQQEDIHEKEEEEVIEKLTLEDTSEVEYRKELLVEEKYVLYFQENVRPSTCQDSRTNLLQEGGIDAISSSIKGAEILVYLEAHSWLQFMFDPGGLVEEAI